jgi:ribosomal protein L12E/L44/L45/RPP1/RPP2
MSTVAERPMTKRNDTAVKIDAEVIRVAKIVAAFEGKSLAEFLSESLKPIVDAKFASHVKQAQPGSDKSPKR